MAAVLKPEWIKPSTILFASEIPANEKAFAFAVAQAAEYGANLILFHAYDTRVIPAPEAPGAGYYDYEAAAAAPRAETERLEPLAERARAAGLQCEIVTRPGLPADQILAYAQERNVGRIVMATRAPGPIGKLLLGSVAEAVLRTASAPVFIVGPEVVDGSTRNFEIGTILCAVGRGEVAAALLAANLAAQHKARLILQHVIRPQDRQEVLAGRSIDQIESDLIALVPKELEEKIEVQAIVVPGDPTEELLYQTRAQHADLIVLGAHGATAFAAITRHGVVYKVLAHSQCPVLTLSPAVLAASGAAGERVSPVETFLAGVF
jgi:nucleotide-binding universal stress UspA family protein